MKNLFVTDLDGTYVKNSVFVEQEDLKAYHDAKKYGDFSVATGRSVEEIKYIAEGNDMDVTHMIGFNGAVVTRQDEVLFEKHIPTKDLTGIFEYLKESKLIFDALDGKQRIGNFDHEKKDRLWNMELICVENPFEILKGKTIYKINVRPTKDQLDYMTQKGYTHDELKALGLMYDKGYLQQVNRLIFIIRNCQIKWNCIFRNTFF